MSRLLCMALGVAGLALAGAAQAPQAPQTPPQQGTKFIGSWKLETAHSTFTPAPGPKDETVTIGETDITIEGTKADGSSYKISYSPVNGQAVPVTGGAEGETITITKVSPRSVHIAIAAGTDKRTGTATLSRSGNTCSVILKGTEGGKPVSAHEVFTRQP